MQISEINNLVYYGFNGRMSLLDVTYPKTDAKLPILFFAHGFKGFKDWGHFPLIAKELASSGFLVVRFNFSHNGGTSEHPIDFPDLEAFRENSYWRELCDIGHLIKWLGEFKAERNIHLDATDLSIIGHSRGGSIALLAAAKFPQLQKVVSWAGVANLMARLPHEAELKDWQQKGVRYINNARTQQNMPMNYSFVEDLYEHSEELKVENAVKKLKNPALIIHGKEDEAVPYDSAIKIKEWNSNVQMELIEGAGHTFGGKHPWSEDQLPTHAAEILNKTIEFLRNS